MPPITWEDTFKTGNPSVDAQHIELFAMINTLHDAIVARRGSEVLGPTLDKLGAYVVKHFQNEEALMRAKRYPGYADHDIAVRLQSAAEGESARGGIVDDEHLDRNAHSSLATVVRSSS